MHRTKLACALCACVAFLPRAAAAQQPEPADSGHVHGDSLTRRPLTMQAITITTTVPMRHEPASAVRVTASEIRQTPALNAWDLLRQTAGLEVHDQGQGPGFASDASLRGFSSDHSADIALWIDGVPINEPVNTHAEGYNDWSLLMPQAVSEIEVLKGPTSALFGNFAFAGTVNVRTLERMHGWDASISGGAFGRIETSLLGGLDRPGTGAIAGLRFMREDGWRPNSGYQLGQGHARWVRDVAAGTSIDAGLEVYAADWDSPGFVSDSLFQLHQFNAATDVTDGGFKRHAQERVSVRRIFNNGVLWRSTAYATQGRWQLFLTIPPEGGSGEGSGSQTEEEDHRLGFGATSAVTWVLARAEVTLGVEGRWDRSEFGRWFTTSRSRDSVEADLTARQASGAVFVQSAFDLTRHVRATLGGRYDVQATRSEPVGGTAASHTAGIFAPKLGLLLHLPEAGAIYANVSRGFRRADGVALDPTVPFIAAWAAEAGLKIDRGPVNANVALFRTDVSDEQSFDPITLTTTSGGRSRRKGLDVDIAVRVSGSVTVDASWTLTDARYRHLVTEDGDTLDGQRVFNTARYVGAGGIRFAPAGRRWFARVSGNVTGPYTPFDQPGTELPAFGLMHVSGGVMLGHASLEVGVRNVLDRVYAEVRAGDFVSPGQPRSIFATLRAAW